MIFLAVLAAATAAAMVAIRGRDRRTAARWGLGIALVVAGIAHLADPQPFEQHLPGWVPAEGVLVAATGVVEIALGLALALARDQRRIVGVVTALYLAAVFPANVYVAVAGVEVDGQPGGVYPWVRLPFQVLFIAWALWSTAQPSPDRGPLAGPIPPLPWTPGPTRADRSAATTTVMASRLELRRFRDVPAFLTAARRQQALFQRSPGAIRLSLKAAPLRRRFWTLSQWVSQEALDAFVRDPAHVEVMQRFGPRIAGSSFVTWTVTDAGAPEWSEAHERLSAADQEAGDGLRPSTTPDRAR